MVFATVLGNNWFKKSNWFSTSHFHSPRFSQKRISGFFIFLDCSIFNWNYKMKTYEAIVYWIDVGVLGSPCFCAEKSPDAFG